ncbi:MAG: ABC transporter permease [Ruminococcus sp.]|jgi:ABC-2 type transport system permease protein|nr:ABC transporter permease [Ruminococcus sp.]
MKKSGNFGALVQNEQIKISKRLGTWILIIIMIALSLGTPVFLNWAFEYEKSSYNYNNEIKDKNPQVEWQTELDIVKEVIATGKEHEYKDENGNVTGSTWYLGDDGTEAKYKIKTLEYYLTFPDIKEKDWRIDALTYVEGYRGGTDELKINQDVGMVEVTEDEVVGDDVFVTESGFKQLITDAEADKRVKELETLIRNDDWRGYLELRKNYMLIDNGIPADTKYDDIVSSNTNLKKEEAEKVQANSWIYFYRLEFDIEPTMSHQSIWQEDEYANKDWKNVLLARVQMARSSIAEYNALDEDEREAYMEVSHSTDLNTVKTSEYRFKHNIEEDLGSELAEFDPANAGFSSMLALMASMVSTMAMMVIVVLAGKIVADEFSAGTIKFLLINPTSRTKIFFAKWLVLMLWSIGLFVVFLALQLGVIALIFGGTEPIGYVLALGDSVIGFKGLAAAVVYYALVFVKVPIMATMAICISSLFKSSSFAVGISIVVATIAPTITQLLSLIPKFNLGKYMIFANIDLANIVSGNTVFVGHNLGAALIVIAVHMVLFLGIGWYSFKRRQV